MAEHLAGIARCESPLEIELGNALVGIVPFTPRIGGDHAWEVGRWDGWLLTLLAQPDYGKYRPDFAIASNLTDESGAPPLIIVVEVDGHEFHEKTREQAERDKRRDRYMVATEARVFRFTGREVYRDAPGCAIEVLDYAFTAQRRFLDDAFSDHLRRAGAAIRVES